MAGLVKEFKEFALKGNMVDLAVGLIIGAAFGAIVNSLVNDIITPLIAGIFKAPDFSNLFLVLRNATDLTFTSVEQARNAGAVVLAYGVFLNALISFLIVAVALFSVVKVINRLRRKQEETPEATPTPADVLLLTEIRDLLKQGR